MNIKPQDYHSTGVLDSTPIKFNFDFWKIRVHIRKGDKVRLTINLDKDQSVAFANFKKVCKPDSVSDDDFLKTIFLTGVEAMNEQLQQVLRKYVKENKEELEASGIKVIEGDDGEIQLQDIPKE